MAVRRGKRNLKLQVSEETPAPVYVILLNYQSSKLLYYQYILFIICVFVLNDIINVIIIVIILLIR